LLKRAISFALEQDGICCEVPSTNMRDRIRAGIGPAAMLPSPVAWPLLLPLKLMAKSSLLPAAQGSYSENSLRPKLSTLG